MLFNMSEKDGNSERIELRAILRRASLWFLYHKTLCISKYYLVHVCVQLSSKHTVESFKQTHCGKFQTNTLWQVSNKHTVASFKQTHSGKFQAIM